jgi:hypothetical protein
VVAAQVDAGVNRRSLLVVAAFVALVFALQPGHDAVGASKNKAGIVVRNADGTTDEMCVLFDEPSISGLDLLNRSGTSHVAERSAIGSAICKIGDGGCNSPSEDCFCEYPRFWGYWIREPGEAKFAFASAGAADHEVRDGSVDGWSWGKDGKPAPPDVPFSDVCAASNVLAERASSERALASQEPARASGPRPNYVAFAGFGVVFAALAGGAVLMRRRRAV